MSMGHCCSPAEMQSTSTSAPAPPTFAKSTDSVRWLARPSSPATAAIHTGWEDSRSAERSGQAQWFMTEDRECRCLSSWMAVHVGHDATALHQCATCVETKAWQTPARRIPHWRIPHCECCAARSMARLPLWCCRYYYIHMRAMAEQ